MPCRVERANRPSVAWLGASVLLAMALAGGAETREAGAAPAFPVDVKLPPDVVYEHVVGRDRAVVFRHGTHVALANGRCTACHPATFRILAPTPLITHAMMKSGQQCGACHDGQHAFGVADQRTCGSCHTGPPRLQPAAHGKTAPGEPVARGPAPIRYARGEGSPGAVTFRHATHLTGGVACARCHPQPFAMRSSAAHPKDMHESTACGACHDGTHAFAAGEARACRRCHAGGGGGTP
jgi:c(7)-type cytochrome triheme protein